MYKDELLFKISKQSNVAQFVSFSPELQLRYSLILGYRRNYRFKSPVKAITALLEQSGEKSVNIRFFVPGEKKSLDFVYGLKSARKVVSEIKQRIGKGWYSLVNETINVKDGGVSGVVQGECIEFSPDDSPRCVEKPGVFRSERKFGIHLLNIIYGFKPNVPADSSLRVEFSIHPLRRGYLRSHTIIWEIGKSKDPIKAQVPTWPNNFSRFIGDKVYGLLIAYALGFNVPFTLVFARRVAPFSFGIKNKSTEQWLRTCPKEQMPGKFLTQKGWTDPYALFNKIDPEPQKKSIKSIEIEQNMAALIWQHGIASDYSGACATSKKEIPIIEGVKGYGDSFMVSEKAPQALPTDVEKMVKKTHADLYHKLGNVRFEWAYSQKKVWILQLHREEHAFYHKIIYKGSVRKYIDFKAESGLHALYDFIPKIKNNQGINLVGDVGLTSHMCDLLRKKRIPSKIIKHQ